MLHLKANKMYLLSSNCFSSLVELFVVYQAQAARAWWNGMGMLLFLPAQGTNQCGSRWPDADLVCSACLPWILETQVVAVAVGCCYTVVQREKIMATANRQVIAGFFFFSGAPNSNKHEHDLISRFGKL